MSNELIILIVCTILSVIFAAASMWVGFFVGVKHAKPRTINNRDEIPDSGTEPVWCMNGLQPQYFKPIKQMMRDLQYTEIRDLMNMSLTILNWVIREKKKGNMICSINDLATLDLIELDIDAIAEIPVQELSPDDEWPDLIE